MLSFDVVCGVMQLYTNEHNVLTECTTKLFFNVQLAPDLEINHANSLLSETLDLICCEASNCRCNS